MASQSLYLRKLNPAGVLLCALLLSLVLACLQSLAAAAAGLCISVAMLAFARPPLAKTAGQLAAVNFFIVFIWLFTPWTTPGQIIWQWKFLAVSRQGLDLSLLATLKCNAIVCLFLALVAPMPTSMLGEALYRLKLPEKLVWMLLLMERNIHILGDVWQKLRIAAKLRGFAPATSLHTYKTIASMLAILILRSFDRAETIRQAMLLRAFSGKLPCLGTFHFGLADAVFALLTLAIGAWLLRLDFMSSQVFTVVKT